MSNIQQDMVEVENLRNEMINVGAYYKKLE
jgi:hypothetical protein